MEGGKKSHHKHSQIHLDTGGLPQLRDDIVLTTSCNSISLVRFLQDIFKMLGLEWNNASLNLKKIIFLVHIYQSFYANGCRYVQ